MQTDKQKILSMLGLARRAGALSMGHDIVQQSIIKNKAQCILFCRDVSPRLMQEFSATMQKNACRCPVFQTPFSMDEVHRALGYKAGVLTVNDKNFANRICELMNQEENEWS